MELSYCKNMTSKILEHPVWCKIKYANLQRCTSITDDGFLFWNNQSNEDNENEFQLEYLNISDCSYLTDESMISITNKCLKLKYLNVSFCCQFTEISVFSLSKLVNCEVLDLSFCGMVLMFLLEAINIKSLEYLSKLETLKFLNLRGCDVDGIDVLLNSNILSKVNVSQW